MSWRDLKVVVTWAAPNGALHRSIDPEGAGWEPGTYLLAGAVDLLAAANWQRAGNKNQKRPNPVPRPGQKNRKAKGRSLTAKALSGGMS